MQGDAEIRACLADPSVRPPWEFDLEEEVEGGADSWERPVYTISEYLDLASSYPEYSDAEQQSEPSENTAESGEDEEMPGADEVLSAEEEGSDSSGDDSDSSEGDSSSSESESEEDEPPMDNPMDNPCRQWFEETMKEWTAGMAPEVAELAQSRDFQSTMSSFFFVTVQAPVR